MSNSVLQLKNVTKKFGGKKVVDGVSVTLDPGVIYGFMGPNGAGKTTTIRMIMNFIRPTSGQVQLFGEIDESGRAAAMQKIGYLSADSNLYPNWTAAQHIAYAERVRGQASNAARLIKTFDFAADVPYHRLSSGNKQKLALVLAMMHQPSLLVLDEPTRGLDPLLQQEIYSLLSDFRKAGGTVFMSSHNLAEVQKVCDKVGIIRGGKLVANETMLGLRKMHVHQVTVQFDKPPEMSQFRTRNMEIVKASKRTLIVNVRGDLNGFLRQVSQNRVVDIEITHISLEEMFMRYYQ